MDLIGYGCALFWVVGKSYVSRWVFTPVQRRPPFARYNEFLRTIDLFCWLSLMGTFFFLLFGERPWLAFVAVVGLLVYNVVLGECFVLWEVGHLRGHNQSRRRFREAHRHVRRRATTLMFH